MTGYTVHTGSNQKFTHGWDQIFSAPKSPSKKAVKTAAKKASAPPAPKTTKPSRKTK